MNASKNKGGLKDRAVRGAIWSMGGFAGVQLIRLAGSVTLAHLLFAEAFGVMSLVTVFVAGVNMFSDIGIGPSIVRHTRTGDANFLNTAWTMQVMRGILICGICWLCAEPFAAFYNEAILSPILFVTGLSAIIGGFASTKLYTANRDLEMARITIVELTSQIVAVSIMISMALVYRSVWALVAGVFASAVTKLVMSHAFLAGVSNRFCWDWEAFGSLFRFGRWIFLSTMLAFLVEQSDRLIFGKMVSISELGVYSIGLMIATLPSMVIHHLGRQIAFPAYSQINRDKGDLKVFFPKVRWPLLIIGGWGLAGLIAGGPTAVHLLYDERYLDAGWIVQVLALGGLFQMMEGTNAELLLAKGKASWVAAGGMAKLVGMVIFIPIGFYLTGFVGAVVAYSLSELLRYAISVFWVRKLGVLAWGQDGKVIFAAIISASVGLLGAEWAQRLGSNIVVEAFVILLVVSLMWLPWLWQVYWEIATGASPFGRKSSADCGN